MIVNALEFAKKTGYPVAMIRAFCREGRLSHWQRGKVYWLDETEALAEMQMLKTTTVHKKKNIQKTRIIRNPLAMASGLGNKFNFRETLRQMKAESKQK